MRKLNWLETDVSEMADVVVQSERNRKIEYVLK